MVSNCLCIALSVLFFESAVICLLFLPDIRYDVFTRGYVLHDAAAVHASYSHALSKIQGVGDAV